MGVFDSIFGGGGINYPAMSPEEKEIVSRMGQLSQGDPELGELYLGYAKRAMRGEEGVSPGLERDIAQAEAQTRERIARTSGALGEIAATAGREAMGRFQEAAGIQREEARRGAMQLGEQLIGARTGRLVGAGQAALSPMERQRERQFMAQQQAAAGGGLMGTLGQAGMGALAAGAFGVSPWLGAGMGALGGGGLLPFMGGGGGAAAGAGGGLMPSPTRQPISIGGGYTSPGVGAGMGLRTPSF